MLASVLLVAHSATCEGADGPGDGFVAADSAGVLIVQSFVARRRLHHRGAAHHRLVLRPGRTGQEFSGPRENGPGDFRQIQLVLPLGSDSVALWDTGNERRTILSSSGDVARALEPRPTYGHLVRIVGMPRDGTFVLTNGLDLASVYGAGYGRQRHSLLALRCSARSAVLLDTIAALPGSELFARASGGTFSFRGFPFGKT